MFWYNSFPADYFWGLLGQSIEYTILWDIFIEDRDKSPRHCRERKLGNGCSQSFSQPVSLKSFKKTLQVNARGVWLLKFLFGNCKPQLHWNRFLRKPRYFPTLAKIVKCDFHIFTHEIGKLSHMECIIHVRNKLIKNSTCKTSYTARISHMKYTGSEVIMQEW